MLRAETQAQPSCRDIKPECLQVTPADFTGHKEIISIDRRKREGGGFDLSFEFRKQRYCYLPEEHAIERLAFPDKARASRNAVFSPEILAPYSQDWQQRLLPWLCQLHARGVTIPKITVGDMLAWHDTFQTARVRL